MSRLRIRRVLWDDYNLNAEEYVFVVGKIPHKAYREELRDAIKAKQHLLQLQREQRNKEK